MKIYNNNDEFGYCGPFEAESFEALADEMMPALEQWADEKLSRYNDQVEEGLLDAEDIPTLEDIIEEMRDDFISGLEDITDEE